MERRTAFLQACLVTDRQTDVTLPYSLIEAFQKSSSGQILARGKPINSLEELSTKTKRRRVADL
ncbi:hypothetical protein J6590_003472 [Homalodisca vitripennis]|nr:hypothetical protein J6590_003472 [Homalodisca vitripennis]